MKHFLLLASFTLLILSLNLSSCKKDPVEDPVVLTGLEKAKKDYTDNYIGTKAVPIGWTGAVAGCLAGTESATVQANVIKRVNYFRRLVGLPDDITLNTSQNQVCQEAALYMIANHTITHYPAGGSCYTPGAAEAAGHGNLAISNGYPELTANHSTNAVTGYIEDPGSNNLAVGHRAWILFPQLTAMGTGSCFDPADNNWTANCLMWGDNLDYNKIVDIDFVAYPPADYIPSSLVFPRWSFSIQGANFNNASVSMTDKSGATIACNVIHKSAQTGYPDARIAWEPSGNFPSGITSDTEYNVTVSGITGAEKASYTYTVKVFYTPETAKRIAPQSGFMEIL